MPRLQVGVMIQKGKRGVPLTKISRIVDDLERFLRMLAEDLSLPSQENNKWVGVDFDGGSFAFVAEKAESATIEQIAEFNRAFSSIADQQGSPPAVRRATVAQYAKIADPIDPNESVSFSLFDPAINGEEGQSAESHSASQLYPVPIAALQIFNLTKNTASAIQAEVQANVKAYGGVQGRMHSLFLGAQPAYFNLRELATGVLVKCFYKSEIYPSIASALQRQDAILHVYGWTKTDLVERKLEEIDVMRVDVASVVTVEEFDSIFGSSSGFTGKLTTQEFIDKARGRGN